MGDSLSARRESSPEPEPASPEPEPAAAGVRPGGDDAPPGGGGGPAAGKWWQALEIEEMRRDLAHERKPGEWDDVDDSWLRAPQPEPEAVLATEMLPAFFE